MIVARNPGLIDLRALKTFGASVKVHDNPIGMFGLGCKQFLAVALRLQHKVTLYRGLDRYEFGTTKGDLRGQLLDLVTMTGPQGTEELPFTLGLGKLWQPWMAFRELASNAIDERGEVLQLKRGLFGGGYQPKEGETAFVVEGAEIEQAYADRDTIFLKGEPLFSSDKLEVHRGESNHVYYRGVRVMDLPKRSLYTYNLTLQSDLTEDRTLKSTYEFDYRLGAAIAATKDEEFLRAVLIAPSHTIECDIPAYSFPPGEAFAKVCGDLRREGHLCGLTSFARNLYERVNSSMPLPDPVTLNAIQQKQLDKAIAFCKSMSWDVDSYPIVVVPHARGGVLALAENGKIVLTLGCFDQGVKVVAHALLEEYLHLRHGFLDMSRELQTHLFRQVLGLAEQLKGEAL